MTRRERGSSSDHASDPGVPHPASGTSPPRQADSAETVSFEDGLAQLGRIVDRLETGDLGLAEAIGAYEEGIALVRRLHGHLAECEQRVEILAGGGSSGGETTQRESSVSRPADDDRTTGGRITGGQRGAPRPTTPPRTGRPRRLPGMDDPGHGV